MNLKLRDQLSAKHWQLEVNVPTVGKSFGRKSQRNIKHSDKKEIERNFLSTVKQYLSMMKVSNRRFNVCYDQIFIS
jgi:hypothetical protein